MERRSFLIGAAAAGLARPRRLLAQAPAPLPPGRGEFAFTGWDGPALRVFTFLPDTVGPTTPILFVLHGVERDAGNYRDAWARRARERGFITIAPEYGEADFPGAETYSSGGIFGRDGAPVPRNRWSFAAIEPLFDEVRARTGSIVPRYLIYGHSGGAQFVHRFVLLMGAARWQRAITANAGWYTMPDMTIDYPYGLRGAPVDRAALAAVLQRPLWILLGAQDTNSRSPNLRQTSEAARQGPNRLARGDSFYAAARQAAAALGVPLAWQRRYVAGVGHDNEAMSAAAVGLVAPAR